MIIGQLRRLRLGRIALLALVAGASLAVLLPLAAAHSNSQASAGWRQPTKVELAGIRRSLVNWACQQNAHCTVAIPGSKIHVGKSPFGGMKVIYATAAIELNPGTQDPQGMIALLYRHTGSAAWWVPGESPYIDAPPIVASQRFSPAICRYAKRKLQAMPDDC
jgi:hypothetical protein